MAKTKKEKKEKKAGKRMKKKELVKALLDFFHVKQDEVLSLKYIFEQLHLTTHPLKMLCMDILSELSDDGKSLAVYARLLEFLKKIFIRRYPLSAEAERRQ